MDNKQNDYSLIKMLLKALRAHAESSAKMGNCKQALETALKDTFN